MVVVHSVNIMVLILVITVILSTYIMKMAYDEMNVEQDVYLGNPNLKKANTQTEFSVEQVKEFIKLKDPIYFAKNYIKIVSLDEGLVHFKMWDFQEELIRNFHENRFNICKMPRQTGKSTTCVAYLLHYVFNDSINVGILATKT